ncbi:RagB/SusD family nutrient uptake outer membrane protein [Olivibacter jilunii]|uniref:RagB/SusD family nutrient uptake outer membrane protein n=1 Tax=Olivibacter jilunii TaxID=985016 RepID=UPI003F153611
MKSIYKIGQILSCGVIVMALLSCSKLLEQEPKNSTYVDEFWQSSRDLRSGIAGNYALLRDAVTSGNSNIGRYYMYGDAIAKQYFTIQYSGDGLEGIQGGDFTFQYNIQSLGNWTKYFKSIAMANVILKQVPMLSDDKLLDVDDPVAFKNNIIGQAYFLRALTYFMMVRVWGDVPIVLEAYDDPISAPQLPRSPKEEVMKQIEKDCHEAAKLLTWGYESAAEAQVTANKGSVYALLAHLYLWRATTTNLSSSDPIMTDVESADTTLNQLIAKGNYRQTDTANYYNTFIGRSQEGIFELNMSEDSREGSSQHIGTFFLRSQQIGYYGTDSRFYVPPNYLTNHFTKLTREWGWVWNTTLNQWEWVEQELKVLDTADIRYRKNFTAVNTDRPTCIKYSNVVFRNPGQKLDAYLSNNLIVFRYSDMLLLKAEIALYKNNVPEAIRIINGFRTRNGASPEALLSNTLTKDEAMYEYMIERGKELFLEGHLYYDLIRTRQYPQFIDWLSESRFSQGGFYWPLDPDLFRNNNQLTQTSYWKGKV